MKKKLLHSYHPLFITAIYFCFGVLWISLSDSVVVSLTSDVNTISLLQTYKGWFFIAVTSLLLYFLSNYFFRLNQNQYEKNLQQLQEHNQIQKASKEQLSKYTHLLHTIVNSSPDAIYAKNKDGNYILFNDAASKLVGLDSENILGKNDTILFNGDSLKKIQALDKKILSSGETITQEEELFIHGEKKIFTLTKGALKNEEGEIFGLFGLSSDITYQKEHESYLMESKEKFYKLSYQDSLTRLPNRLSISEVLTKLCTGETHFALIFLDLDEFKLINDSYGHRFGDKILLKISQLLHKIFNENGFVARMGGDEFGIILYTDEEQNIVHSIKRLHIELSNPFSIDGIDIYMTASSGIALYPKDASTMDDLYQAADVAMFNAKKVGKNQFSFYNSRFKEETLFKTQTITNLKQAIDKGELELYYQIQINPYNKKAAGAEALLRWNCQGEMIPPSVFIPLAEKTSLIIDIGDFVLERGFQTALKWQELNLLEKRIAINISAKQLTHTHFIQTLQATLKKTGSKPEWIELEITESSVLENPKIAVSVLKKIKELGFFISMDDFGTGYSSLSYLKNLPIDKLKIDRAFIQDIHKEPKNQIIVRTIIFLAKELGIEVLAEGAETQDEIDFLTDAKIDSVQGYYYHKPLPLEMVEQALQN